MALESTLRYQLLFPQNGIPAAFRENALQRVYHESIDFELLVCGSVGFGTVLVEGLGEFAGDL